MHLAGYTLFKCSVLTMILSAEPYLLSRCSFLCLKGRAKLNLLAISHVQSVHTLMHMYVCVCVTRMGRGQQRTLGILFYHPLSHFLGMSLSLNIELGWQSASPQPIAGPVSHTTGMNSTRPCLAFYPGAEDLNSELHVSQQTFLPVEPSPFPNDVNLMVPFFFLFC